MASDPSSQADEARWQLHDELHEAKEEVIRERMDGHWVLDDHRWIAHAREHEVIEKSLDRYKTDSNEWRGSLSDLRGSFATQAEVDLRLGLHETRLGTLENARQHDVGRSEGVVSARQLLYATVSIVATIIGVGFAVLGITR